MCIFYFHLCLSNERTSSWLIDATDLIRLHCIPNCWENIILEMKTETISKMDRRQPTARHIRGLHFTLLLSLFPFIDELHSWFIDLVIFSSSKYVPIIAIIKVELKLYTVKWPSHQQSDVLCRIKSDDFFPFNCERSLLSIQGELVTQIVAHNFYRPRQRRYIICVIIVQSSVERRTSNVEIAFWFFFDFFFNDALYLAHVAHKIVPVWFVVWLI